MYVCVHTQYVCYFYEFLNGFVLMCASEGVCACVSQR